MMPQNYKRVTLVYSIKIHYVSLESL